MLSGAILLAGALVMSGAAPRIVAACDGMGAIVIVLLLAAIVQALRSRRADRRDVIFLIVWVCLEALAAVAISPFAAARRVIELTIAMTILAGRLAMDAQEPESAGRPFASAWIAAAVSILFGAFYFATDMDRAALIRRSVFDARDFIARQDSPGSPAKVWYVGHWGFQHYAQHVGMIPVVPGVSRLEPGDWIVVPADVDQQSIALPPTHVALETTLEVRPTFTSLSTVPGYYLGEAPLNRPPPQEDRIDIYRVTRTVIPRTGWPTPVLLEWFRHRLDAHAVPPAAVHELELFARVADPATKGQIRALLERYRSQP
jgi:hypothetical protein